MIKDFKWILRFSYRLKTYTDGISRLSRVELEGSEAHYKNSHPVDSLIIINISFRNFYIQTFKFNSLNLSLYSNKK